MKDLQRESLLVVRLSAQIFSNLRLVEQILLFQQIPSNIGGIRCIHVTALSSIRNSGRRLLVEAQDDFRFFLSTLLLGVVYLDQRLLFGSFVLRGRFLGCCCRFCFCIVCSTLVSTVGTHRCYRILISFVVCLFFAAVAQINSCAHRDHDAGMQRGKDLTQRAHCNQTQFSMRSTEFFHSDRSGACHQTQGRRGCRRDATGIMIRLGTFADPRQRVDDAMEQINCAQVAIVVQENFRQRCWVGTDLFKQRHHQRLVLDRRILGVQDDEEHVGHEGFDFRFQDGTEVADDGHEDAQRQIDDSRVVHGAILEQRHAEVVANGVMELRSTSEQEGSFHVSVGEHVQEQIQCQQLGRQRWMNRLRVNQ
mmetsp:Transcript_25255/g.70760  ORF Transcript_25255/g.70760 Transcript_25255/m.70760 type:complete len:364 (-) Transcript_25255:2506-3597(-)